MKKAPHPQRLPLFGNEIQLFQGDLRAGFLKLLLEILSLSLVDLVGIVQFKCKVLIPSAELKSIKTFSDLYDYVESHLPDSNKQ